MRLLALVGLFAVTAVAAPQKENLPAGAVSRLATQVAPGKGKRPAEIAALVYLGPDALFVGTTGGWNTWDVQKRQPRQARPVGDPVFAAGGDAECLFVGSAHKLHAIEPLESPTAEPARSWESATEAVGVVAVAPGGRRVAFVDGEHMLTVVDPKTGKPIGAAELPGRPTAAALAANGRVLAVVTAGGAVRVGGLSPSGHFKPQWTRRVTRADRTAIQFSPDGRLLAVSSAGRVALLESVTGRPFVSLDRKFGESDVRAIAFSADGRLLATASGGPDAVVRVWDVQAARELTSFTGHRGDVNAVAFAPDGKALASGGTERAVLIWKVPAAPAPKKAMPLAEAWESLDALDGRTAYAALGSLLSDPARARDVIRTGYRGMADEQKKVRRWIAELDHDEFRVRETARRALLKAGLRAATEINDPARKKLGAEGEERVRSILATFDEQGIRVPESGLYGETVRMVRAVRVLEATGGKESEVLLREMAKGPAESPATQEAKAVLETLPSDGR